MVKKKPKSKTSWAYEEAQARREFERNRRLVEAGETYRSRRKTGPEKAPGQTKDRI